jgi:hypothetical protein
MRPGDATWTHRAFEAQPVLLAPAAGAEEQMRAVLEIAVDPSAGDCRHRRVHKAFAERNGLDPWIVEGWEQERFGLDRSAHVLPSVIAHEPKAVVRSLRASKYRPSIRTTLTPRRRPGPSARGNCRWSA